MSHGGARPNAGRPRVSAAAASTTTINDRTNAIDALLHQAGLQDDYESLRLLFIRKTRLKVGHKAARIIKEYAHEENVAKEAFSALRKRPKVLTKEDALSILLHVDLSRHQYQTLRTLLNNAAEFRNLLPSYELVRLYKTHCAPTKDSGLYTERRAEVRLQDLLNHTAERAVASNADNIKELVSRRRGRIECEFVMTWGADGASEHSQYQQRHHQRENIGKSDNSLFAVVVNPVILKTKRGICLWKNPAVQSHLFLRPLVLEFEKETKGYVQRMKAHIDAQIHQLRHIDVETESGIVLRIRFRMLATMIDGKIFCYFVNKPFSSCPICSATKNDLRRSYALCVGTPRFEPLWAALFYGLQVLHAWINFANHLTKIPLRIARDEAKSVAAEEGLDYDSCKRLGKNAWNARLEEIKNEFLQEDLHLGTTINGNMARLLFGPRRDLFERVTGVDRRIIERFRIILICVNTTRYKLKPLEFQAYCAETRDLYLDLYPEYPLTPTIHKVLEHAVQVQEAMDQILGEVSEGAAEAKHRIRKQIRRYRARKTSKKDNLTDVMDRCLHLSDPKLSLKYSSRVTKFRDARRSHVLGQLPDEAEALLQTGNEQPPPPPEVVEPRRRAVTPRQRPVLQVQDENVAPDDDDSEDSDAEQLQDEIEEDDHSDDDTDLSDGDVTDGNLTDDDSSDNDEFMDE